MPRSFGTSLLAYKPFLQGRKENHMAFKPQTLDFEKSPYTGLVRESWIEAGKYLLDGIFQNIARFEDPVVLLIKMRPRTRWKLKKKRRCLKGSPEAFLSPPL